MSAEETRQDWLKAELAKAASLVGTARRLLATGTMVDLTALEGRVRLICEAVSKLEPEQARRLRPAMEDLLADLDRLDTDLRAAAPSFDENAAG